MAKSYWTSGYSKLHSMPLLCRCVDRHFNSMYDWKRRTCWTSWKRILRTIIRDCYRSLWSRLLWLLDNVYIVDNRPRNVRWKRWDIKYCARAFMKYRLSPLSYHCSKHLVTRHPSGGLCLIDLKSQLQQQSSHTWETRTWAFAWEMRM